MLKEYKEDNFEQFDLSEFNIKYTSDDKAIFIAQWKEDIELLTRIQTYSKEGTERSFSLSKDLVDWYKLMHDKYNPLRIEFCQKDEDLYNYILMVKLCKKFGYRKIDSKKVGRYITKYIYKRVD